MTEISQERRAKVVAALAHYDDLSRDDRAGRVLWLSQHNMSPGVDDRFELTQFGGE